MKNWNLMIVCLLAFMKGDAQADTIEAGLNKTITIVFPQMIKAVDRGSRDILVQQLKEVENVLQLKAGREYFEETNLTVITVEGKLYSFIVRYTADPPRLYLNMDGQQTLVEKLAAQPAVISGIKDARFDMILDLQGIYIDQDILYFQLALENTSSVTYDIELLQCYTRDKKPGKRTARQEIQLPPLLMQGNSKTVPAQTRQALVIALSRFTIPDKKNCYISLNEKNGGRNLRIRIRNSDIFRAIPVKQL